MSSKFPHNVLNLGLLINLKPPRGRSHNRVLSCSQSNRSQFLATSSVHLRVRIPLLLFLFYIETYSKLAIVLFAFLDLGSRWLFARCTFQTLLIFVRSRYCKSAVNFIIKEPGLIRWAIHFRALPASLSFVSSWLRCVASILLSPMFFVFQTCASKALTR